MSFLGVLSDERSGVSLVSGVEFFVVIVGDDDYDDDDATDGQLASPSWCKHLFGAHDQILIFFGTIAWFLVWCAVSDERTGL
jgi:hypothetical protein